MLVMLVAIVLELKERHPMMMEDLRSAALDRMMKMSVVELAVVEARWRARGLGAHKEENSLRR